MWSPSNPHLYDLHVDDQRGGQVLDEVDSYFAMRQVRAGEGFQSEQLRFTLNGKPLFLYGPLDQGYFPDGLYTPASEEAMLFDIEYIRQLGCNMHPQAHQSRAAALVLPLRPPGDDRLAGYAQWRTDRW